MELKPHPQSAPSPIHTVEAEVERRGDSGLSLTYRLHGDLSRLKLPEMVEEPGRTDELWRHTCFEAFVGPVGSEGYLEFNFATSLQWASYRFTGYRADMAGANVEPWAISGRVGPEHVEMTVEIDPGRMARPDLPAPAWRVGISVVVEDIDGGLSYWALAHPSPFPDFHHAQSFVLDLPVPEHP